ncbi:unnamed protein product [Oikopleura dioica]|uniref:Uncharacterized protein n=1 Tax=Oikopleura dioica TaxID=34765 RepID=E4XAQ1_OIKDI|nr:unnamed protein product [Oikopleura dioica]
MFKRCLEKRNKQTTKIAKLEAENLARCKVVENIRPRVCFKERLKSNTRRKRKHGLQENCERCRTASMDSCFSLEIHCLCYARWSFIPKIP